MTTDVKTNKYMHKSYSEMMAFKAKIRSECVLFKDDPNVKKLIKGGTLTPEERADANENLHAIIIRNIGCETLLNTLGSRTYLGQGDRAIKYITDSFSPEDDESKQEAREARYNKLVSTKLKKNITRLEFNSIHAEMSTIVDELTGTDYNISSVKYARDLTQMVAGINKDYDDLVYRKLQKKPEAERKSPAVVASALEGIIALKEEQGEGDPEVDANTIMIQKLQLEVELLKQERDNRDSNKHRAFRFTAELDPCDACGIAHPGDTKTCHALLLSQGQPVPGWANKNAALKKRLEERGQEIKDKGMFKDRAKVKMMDVVIDLTHVQHGAEKLRDSLPVSVRKTEFDNVAQRPGSTTLFVDSQGAPRQDLHFIKDIALFNSEGFTMGSHGISVSGVTSQGGAEPAQGKGSVTV